MNQDYGSNIGIEQATAVAAAAYAISSLKVTMVDFAGKKRPQNWFRRQISWQMNQDYDSNIGIEQATAIAAAAYAISSLKVTMVDFAGKKRHQNWFRRHISWQMNQDYDSNIGIEQETAVAATAYAISSLKGSSNIPEQKKISQGPDSSFAPINSRKEAITTTISSPEQKKIREGPDTSLARTKSRKEHTTPPPKVSSSELGEDTMGSPEILLEKIHIDTAPLIKKTPTFTDQPDPQMEKIPTFAEEQLRRADKIRPEKPEMGMPKPDLPKFDRQTSTIPEITGTEADVWERTELARIKKKHEELNARILSWENKKKTKSRHRLNKTESELERKRLKAFEKFHSEVDDINQIAAGARSKAKERQRKEELKAKEKANQIRKTGKVPNTCSCF